MERDQPQIRRRCQIIWLKQQRDSGNDRRVRHRMRKGMPKVEHL